METYLENFDFSQIEGREVMLAALAEDELRITFTDLSTLTLRDAGQSCCEHRYTTTDDDPDTLVGNLITSITEKAGPCEEDGYHSHHDSMFVEIQSTGGFITLVNHNKHNGYYGGFSVKLDFKVRHKLSHEEKQFKRELLSGVTFQRRHLP